MAKYEFSKKNNTDDDFHLNDDSLWDDSSFDDLFADIDSNPTRDAKNAKIDVKKIFAHATNTKTIKEALISNIFNNKLRDVKDEYVKWKETVDEQKEVVSDSLVNLLSETKQFAKIYGSKVDSYLPENVKSAKSEFIKLLDKYTEKNDTDTWRPQSEESIKDEHIASSLAEIFKEQEKVKQAQDLQDRTEKFTEKLIEGERFKQSFTVSDKIRLNTDYLTKFTKTVYTAYLKESLKIKYKHLFVSQDILKTVKESARLNAEYLNRITTNTSLPDIVKQTFTDLTKYKIKQKTIGTIGDKLASYVQDVGKRAANTLTGFIGGASQGLGLLNMAGSFMDGPVDPNKLIGESIAKGVGSMLSDTIFGPKTPLGAALNVANKEAATATKRLFLKSGRLESDNLLLDAIFKILKPEGVFGETPANIGVSDPTSPAIFDNLTRLSITEVIPGYLAKILKQVTEINTGFSSEELVFDAKKSRDFVTVSSMQKQIREDLFGSDASRARQMGQVIGTLRGNFLLNSTDREEDEKLFKERDEDLRRLFTNFASERKDLDFSMFRRILKQVNRNIKNGKNPDDGLLDSETYKKLYKGIKDPIAVTKIMVQAIKARDAKGNEYFDRVQENEIFNSYVDNLVFSDTYDAKYQEKVVDFGNARLLKEHLAEKDGRFIFDKDKVSNIKNEIDKKIYSDVVTFQSRISADDSRMQQLYFRKLPQFFRAITDVIFYDKHDEIIAYYKEKGASLTDPLSLYRVTIGGVKEFFDYVRSEDDPNKKGSLKDRIESVVDEYSDLFTDDSGNLKFDIGGLYSACKRAYSNKKKGIREHFKESMRKKGTYEEELAKKASSLDSEDINFSDYSIDSLDSESIASDTSPERVRRGRYSRKPQINIPAAIDLQESTIEKLTKPIVEGLSTLKNTFVETFNLKDFLEEKKRVNEEDPAVTNKDHPLQLALKKYDSIIEILRDMNDRVGIASLASTGDVDPELLKKALSASDKRNKGGLGNFLISAGRAAGQFVVDVNKTTLGLAKDTVLGTAELGLKYGGSILSGAGQLASGAGSGLGRIIHGIGKGYGATARGIGSGLSRIFKRGTKEDPFFDVYRKDEVEIGKPLLTRKQQRLGEVVFADGTRIEYTSEIDQPVIEIATKTTLISQEDIEHGLVDVDNNPITSRVGSTGKSSSDKGLPTGLLGAGFKGAGKLLSIGKNVLLDPYMAVMKLGLSGAGAVGGLGLDLVKRFLGFDTNGATGQRKMLFEVVGARIDRIYNLLATKFEVPGFDPVEIKDDGSTPSKLSNAGKFILSKVLNPKKTSEEVKEKIDEAKDKYDEVKEKFNTVVDKTSTIFEENEKARELKEKVKKSEIVNKARKAKDDLVKSSEKYTTGFFRDTEYKEENSPEEGTKTLKKMYKLLEKQDKEKKADKKKEKTEGFFDSIKDMFGSMFGGSGGWIARGKSFLTNAGKNLLSTGRNAFSSMGNLGSKAFSGLRTLATKYGPQLLKGGRFLANSAARFLASPLGMVAAPVATAVAARAFANSDAAKDMFGEKNFNNAHEILDNLDEDSMDPSSMELEDGTPMTIDNLDERIANKKAEDERKQKEKEENERKYKEKIEEAEKKYGNRKDYPTKEQMAKMTSAEWASAIHAMVQYKVSIAYAEKLYKSSSKPSQRVLNVTYDKIEKEVRSKMFQLAYDYATFPKRKVEENPNRKGHLRYVAYWHGAAYDAGQPIDYEIIRDDPPKGIKVDIPVNLQHLATVAATNNGSGNIDPKAKKEASKSSTTSSNTSTTSSTSTKSPVSVKPAVNLVDTEDIETDTGTSSSDSKSSAINSAFWGTGSSSIERMRSELKDFVKNNKDSHSGSDNTLVAKDASAGFRNMQIAENKARLAEEDLKAPIRYHNTAELMSASYPSVSFAPKAPPSGKEEILAIIKAAALKVGIDPDVAATIANVESSLNPEAKASTSSAGGLFQFVDSTWKEKFKKYAPKHDLGYTANRFDPRINAIIGCEYLKENSDALKPILKREANVVELYLAHFLGTNGAKKFLKEYIKDANKPSTIAVSSKTITSNAPIFKDKTGKIRTLKEVYNFLANRLNAKAISVRSITAANIDIKDTSIGSDTTVANKDMQNYASNKAYEVNTKKSTVRTDVSAGTELDSRASHKETFTPPSDTKSLGQTPYADIPSASTSLPSHESTVETKEGVEVVRPTDSDVITSPFGPRNVRGGSKDHRGIDLRARTGDPVYSIADNGIVTVVGGSYGIIEIAYKDLKVRVRYLHLSKFNVRQGDVVKKGQVIGLAGGTGPNGPNQYTPHLHFDVRPYGIRYYDKKTCIDPEKWFKTYGVTFRRKGESGNTQMTPMSEVGVEEKKANATGSVATPSSDINSPANMMNQTTGNVSTGKQYTTSSTDTSSTSSVPSATPSNNVTTGSHGVDKETQMLTLLTDIKSGITKLNETLPTLDTKTILTSIKDLMKTSNEYLKNGFNTYSSSGSSSSSMSNKSSSSSSVVSAPKMSKNKVSLAKA